ncbi:MAG: 30S ribosomal protein S20 [candidate division Zixibacteria bacterium]
MPNHKSCVKRMRQSLEQRTRNRAYRSQLRAAIKELRAETNKEEAVKKLNATTSLLDKAASSHLMHRSTAARSISRLTCFVNKLA